MKPLRVSKGIVTIAQFKNDAPRWLRQVAESGEPVVITLNGRPAGVLVSPEEFDRLQERHHMVESAVAGLADPKAGRSVLLAALKKRLAAKQASGS